MNHPAILIAGTKSGVGKTTITLGIIGALEEKGMRVQPFKVGPDFIDPGLHQFFTRGRAKSHNLDTWMLSVEENRRIFREHSRAGAISVIEGVMGLFDGAPTERDLGSTAHVAKILDVPVILVIDCHGLARSILPLLRGFVEFDQDLSIRGVILNRVGSQGHADFLKQTISGELPDMKVIGAIPRNEQIAIPARHLGLHTAHDLMGNRALMERLTQLIGRYIDIEALLSIAGHAKPVCRHDSWAGGSGPSVSGGVRVGVAMDEAFSFYYHENLAALERCGAELVFFSPVRDARLPDVDAVYIGGGYPELYASDLSRNSAMLHELRGRIRAGMPCYSECGGMMYLSQGIYAADGTFSPMVGVLPFSVRMLDGLRSLGYREVELVAPCIIGDRGMKARGHEFHYSEVIREPVIQWKAAYNTRNARGHRFGDQGFLEYNILSSYVHLHFCSNHSIARNFVRYIGGG